MSLINDALKKAQKMRSHDDGSAVPQAIVAGARSGSSRGPALANYWILLIVAGAAVLVSVSVFATVYFLRKPVSSIAIKSEDRALSSTEPASATLKSEQSASATSESPSLILPSLPTTETKPSSPARASTPEPIVASREAATTPATTVSPRKDQVIVQASEKPTISQPALAKTPTVAASPQAAPVAAPSEVSKFNLKAQTFVDTLKVTGIRASGEDSKVLMNDRVYRINDLVERSLGLRLIEVSTERLVFVDENGIRYIRNF